MNLWDSQNGNFLTREPSIFFCIKYDESLRKHKRTMTTTDGIDMVLYSLIKILYEIWLFLRKRKKKVLLQDKFFELGANLAKINERFWRRKKKEWRY
jgi:hypothetical protein